MTMNMRQNATNVPSFLCCFRSFLKGTVRVTAFVGDVIVIVSMSDDPAFLSRLLGRLGAFGKGSIWIAALK
jgi:hypothetical protein